MTARRNGLSLADVARCWAGFASLGAGLIHLAVVQEHLDHWALAGAFFVVIGAMQLGWGLAALARDTAPFLGAFVAVNLGVIVLWALSRTAGLPIGPEAGTAEAVGTADTLCVALELLVVASLVVALLTARRAISSPSAGAGQLRAGRGLVALGVGALVVSALTTPALAATASGEHSHPHGDHGTPHTHPHNQ